MVDLRLRNPVDRLCQSLPVAVPDPGTVWSWRALAFSAGGDGGRKAPELPRNTTFAGRRDCWTTASHLLPRALTNPLSV